MKIENIYEGHNVIIFHSACKAMSGKVCSSNSVAQAQKLVAQLQLEASMERIKVCLTRSAFQVSHVAMRVLKLMCPFKIASNFRSL